MRISLVFILSAMITSQFAAKCDKVDKEKVRDMLANEEWNSTEERVGILPVDSLDISDSESNEELKDNEDEVVGVLQTNPQETIVKDKPGNLRGSNPQFPLYYTSYHLFAPSLDESTNVTRDYFDPNPPQQWGDHPFGYYQNRADEIFHRHVSGVEGNESEHLDGRAIAILEQQEDNRNRRK